MSPHRLLVVTWGPVVFFSELELSRETVGAEMSLGDLRRNEKGVASPQTLKREGGWQWVGLGA